VSATRWLNHPIQNPSHILKSTLVNSIGFVNRIMYMFGKSNISVISPLCVSRLCFDSFINIKMKPDEAKKIMQGIKTLKTFSPCAPIPAYIDRSNAAIPEMVTELLRKKRKFLPPLLFGISMSGPNAPIIAGKTPTKG